MALTDPQEGSVQKTEYLQARATERQKRLIQRAADLEGRSLTDFMLDHLQGVALRIIREHEILSLGTEDSQVFVAAMLHPPKPNEKLKSAIQWYQDVSSESLPL